MSVSALILAKLSKTISNQCHPLDKLFPYIKEYENNLLI